MIRYRDATPADAQALNDMAVASFRETFEAEYEPDDFAEYLGRAYGPDGLVADVGKPSITFRLALDDDRIVGYAKVSALAIPYEPAAPGAMELRQLYVLSNHHGSGIAAALMDWTIATARAAGASELYLAVFEFNHRARAFYTRYGFVEVGEFPFRLGKRIDRDRIWQLKL